MNRASLLLLFVLGVPLACKPHSSASPPSASEGATPLRPLDSSLYLLDDKWLDQNGLAFELAQLKGELVITSMIFTHCKFACPRIIEDLKAIEANLPQAARPRVRFLLVTMDTDRDTPAVLKAFAEEHHLAPENWTLLHGDSFAVRGIAATLGVDYQRAANGDFSHSNLISLLDTNGCLVQQISGLGADSTPLMNTINSHLDAQ